MKKYFLDTSVIIDYIRGRDEAISLMDKLDGELSSSYICLAEIYEGLAGAITDKEKKEEAAKTFFRGLDEIYGLNEEIAIKFGTIRAELRRKKQMIPDMDLFLAATCLTQNLVLVTGNLKHFRRIENLQIYFPETNA